MKVLTLIFSSRIIFFNIVILAALLFLSTGSHQAQAMGEIDKTQNDVYSLSTVFRRQVVFLLNENGHGTTWPDAGIQHNKYLRQVFQKGLDVISKIDHFRKTRGLGPIATGYMPGRAISLNEVFDLVKRLVHETDILLPVKNRNGNTLGKLAIGKTANDTYKLLSEAGVAFDKLIGEQGIEPTDVFARSMHVLKEVQFLNKIQSPSLRSSKPEKPSGKHSNHSLEMVTALLAKISQAQRNLWIEPVVVPEVPRRVIKPVDVYNTMDIVLGELLRIKYRLGRERHFVKPQVVEMKTPDDVIQILNWAKELMPLYSPGQEINQSNQLFLEKDTNHAYSLSLHVIRRLIKFNQERGIQKSIKIPDKVGNILPRHVLQTSIEGLEKINLLRNQNGLASYATVEPPLRDISQQDMFESILRLEHEFDIILVHAGMESNSWLTSTEKEIFHDKTASDVYQNMRHIIMLLDAGISSKAFTIDELHAVAGRVLEEVKLLSRRFDQLSTGRIDLGAVDKTKIKGRQVYVKGLDVLKLVRRAQQRGGLKVIDKVTSFNSINTDLAKLHNLVRFTLAELVDLKLHLGLHHVASRPESQQDKTYGEVYMLLEEAHTLLTQLIEGEK